jgi:splicing suppressor protein 51
MNIAERILPIRTAYTGLCCANCMKTPAKLVQCSGCKRVKYCNKACQVNDWRSNHKHECTVLQTFREQYDSVPGPDLRKKAASFTVATNLSVKGGWLPAKLMDKWPRHRMFLVFPRVCSICLKNEYQTSPSETASSNCWKNCPTCRFGWCCSEEHWKEYNDTQHTPEICQKYVRSLAIEHFLWKHAKKYDDTFLNIPESSLTELISPFPKDWSEYFKLRFGHVYDAALTGRLPPEFFPASTHELSQAVTCLYAMYEHGIEHFQDLTTLCIHIVGAGSTYEIFPTCVWEEITHCLPNVKTLKTVFVGPEACPDTVPPTDNSPLQEIQACPTCTTNGRKRVFALYGFTYHDFHNKFVVPQGDEPSSSLSCLKPDLVVAFNTGMHEVDAESWKTSLQVIMDTNVPSIFTSYNRSEADQDYALLEGLGAGMLHDAPKRNPFSEIKPEIDCTETGVDEFYHNSMYCMSFKGRD